METETLNAAGIAAAYDFSIWSLFLRADFIVKAVMIALIVASIWCWAIIFEKVRRLRRLNGDASSFEDRFWSGGSLDELYDNMGAQPRDPMSAVFSAAMREWRRTAESGYSSPAVGSSLMERIGRVMDVTVNREIERVERQLTILASTGSTAPFIGLFGTVWGIKTAFEGIAMSQDTSLAVVAPGIAEALLATALGLLAAIPAVVFYNKLSGDAERVTGNWEAFSDEFSTLLSRQLDSEV